MRMQKFICSSFVAFCCMAVISCSLKPVESTIKHRYALTEYSKQRLVKNSSNRIILVTMPDASPEVKTANIVYVDKPYHMQRFATSVWVAPPSTMLLPLLTGSLRSSGYFQAVIAAPRSSLSNVRLDTQLLMLEHEFISRPSQVRMSMQATLSDDKTNQVLASRRFATAVTVNVDNPYAGVVAANHAAEQLTKKITAFVVANSRG